MHHHMNTILKGLRQDVAHCLDPESIDAACRAAGYTWRNWILKGTSLNGVNLSVTLDHENAYEQDSFRCEYGVGLEI